jgi:acetate kinase
MKILVINSGSSSIKYQLFSMPDGQTRCSGLVERVGLKDSVITHKVYTGTEETAVKRTLDLPDHGAGLAEVTKLLTDAEIGVIRDPAEIPVVGHRVVHGGERFAATTVIDQAVKTEIQKLFPLAPLHNPANFQGIEVAEKIFAKARQIAVFDTAFHQTMPEKAYRYAIPREYYTEAGIRAYGFHGTSHKYVAGKAAEYLNKPDARIITLHLGNGSSATAVAGGKSLETSMGFGPMNGLIMGTRPGDIDQSVIFHLADQLGFSLDKIRSTLNKQSGMFGLTGFSDMRDITRAMDAGDANAGLAYEMYTYRIKKYVGAYAAVLNGLDALVFTAGVGENDARVREMVCRDMEYLGMYFDAEKNQVRSREIREITRPDSPVKVLVIPTNEELEIARQCYELIGRLGD